MKCGKYGACNRCVASSSSRSGVAQAGIEKAKQFLNAKSITIGLVDVLSALSRAEGKLQNQLAQLCGAFKCEQIQESLRIMMENNNLAVESYRSAFNAPTIRLDFESEDEKGHSSTPEGKPRHFIFISTTAKNVTVARGAKSPIHGTSGMAGV